MHLNEQLSLGDLHARNRVMFGPHVTNLGRRRALSERHVEYYQRRAAGGAGIIVTEEASVHESDWPYERSPLATDCADGWSSIAVACQAEGALVIAAIGHAGMQGSSAYSQRETWAPSAVPDAVTREQPKTMEPIDIRDVLNGFQIAAATAARGGVDGVEINAGQHSLVRQFMSGLTNQRGDEWGLENGPLVFPLAVIERVRRAVGPGKIVGLRLSCDELAPWAGITPESAADIAAQLSELVDYITVVRGSIYSADATTPDSHTPAGFNLDLARDIRAAVDGRCPVFAQGSIVDVGQAEWAIDDGRADGIEMTRAQIADPDLCNKLAAGVADQVRPCLLCNQTCRVRDGRNPLITCTVNPGNSSSSFAFPRLEPSLRSSSAPKRPERSSGNAVHVVGAGPAGLEAARVCAEAGLTVNVWETGPAANALVRTWSKGSGREPLAKIADWLESECARLGVVIHFDHRVALDEAQVWRDEGACVIVATGGQRREAEYVVEPGAIVLDSLDVLAGAELPDGPVAIWDPIGGPIGISVAESLIPHRPVSLVVPDQIAGTMLSLSGDLAGASTRLAQAGIEIVKRAELLAAQQGSALVESRVDGSTREIECVAIIDAGHRVPADDSMAFGEAKHLVAGDGVAPRTLHEAILEGRRAALALVGGQ